MDERRLQKLLEAGENVLEDFKRLGERKGKPIVEFLEYLEPGVLWTHAGYTGHGKTLFALNAAFYWTTSRLVPLKVTYLTGEEPEKLKKKAESIGLFRPDNLTILKFPLRRALQELPPHTKILIVDPLQKMKKYENVGYGRIPGIMNLKLLSQDLGIGVFVINTLPRRVALKARREEAGSIDYFSSLEYFKHEIVLHSDFVTTSWNYPVRDQIDLQWLKSREGPLPNRMFFDIDPSGTLHFQK